jgi:transcription initiation factor IIE alpha subunit
MIGTGSVQGGVSPRLSIAALWPHGARMATCPECEYDEIDAEDYEVGDMFNCPECGKKLVSTGNDEVDLADEDEDDDLEDDDDEDLEDDDEEDDEDEDEDEEDLDD